MTITRVNPEGLHHTAGYAHITIVESSRLIALAGQCPIDADGELVGRGDLAAQVNQVVTNVSLALTAAGVTPAHVCRSVIYVVSDDPDVLAAVWRQLVDSEIGPAFTTASTLLGVAALGYGTN
jgi:enamine deaminase RidA (YjgF/YER057c/UK114 family)